MRTPEKGMPLLREATGASDDDDRLIGVQLDLMDAASIAAAAKAIEEAVGAPFAIVHNAGISAAGMVEETDMALWQNMFAYQRHRPGRTDQGVVAVDASGGRGAHRAGIQRGRGARSAGHRAVLGGQGGDGALG